MPKDRGYGESNNYGVVDPAANTPDMQTNREKKEARFDPSDEGKYLFGNRNKRMDGAKYMFGER